MAPMKKDVFGDSLTIKGSIKKNLFFLMLLFV